MFSYCRIQSSLVKYDCCRFIVYNVVGNSLIVFAEYRDKGSTGFYEGLVLWFHWVVHSFSEGVASGWVCIGSISEDVCYPASDVATWRGRISIFQLAELGEFQKNSFLESVE